MTIEEGDLKFCKLFVCRESKLRWRGIPTYKQVSLFASCELSEDTIHYATFALSLALPSSNTINPASQTQVIVRPPKSNAEVGDRRITEDHL